MAKEAKSFKLSEATLTDLDWIADRLRLLYDGKPNRSAAIEQSARLAREQLEKEFRKKSKDSQK